LHMSPSIRSTPLAAAVQGARADTANLVSQLSGNGINTGGGQ
jgi:hypothetical protein